MMTQTCTDPADRVVVPVLHSGVFSQTVFFSTHFLRNGIFSVPQEKFQQGILSANSTKSNGKLFPIGLAVDDIVGLFLIF